MFYNKAHNLLVTVREFSLQAGSVENEPDKKLYPFIILLALQCLGEFVCADLSLSSRI